MKTDDYIEYHKNKLDEIKQLKDKISELKSDISKAHNDHVKYIISMAIPDGFSSFKLAKKQANRDVSYHDDIFSKDNAVDEMRVQISYDMRFDEDKPLFLDNDMKMYFYTQHLSGYDFKEVKMEYFFEGIANEQKEET